jgi:hypothetical protein
MAAIDIATHGRIAISQKGNVAERNFSKVRIEEWPGSHKVAHTPQHLAGQVVKGEAEISNDSLRARFSAKPPGLEKKLLFFYREASRGPRPSQHARRGAHQRQASIFHPAQPVGARIAYPESAAAFNEAAGCRRAGARRTMPRPDGTRRENRS